MRKITGLVTTDGSLSEEIELLKRMLLELHAQLGVFDQTRLDVVSARNDSGQAGIGWCLVIGILDQHSQFATDRVRATVGCRFALLCTPWCRRILLVVERQATAAQF